MNKDNKKVLKQWETATQNLSNEFTNKYFKDSASDIYWIGNKVGNEVGSILCVNDYFFDINRIYEAIKYNASAKRLFEYYDKEIEFAMKEQSMPVNFKTYLKTGVFNISKKSNISKKDKKDKKDKKEIKMEEKW